jgi:hypothetical protein
MGRKQLAQLGHGFVREAASFLLFGKMFLHQGGEKEAK